MKTLNILLVGITCLLASIALADPATGNKTEVLRNDSIIGLTKLHLGDSVIVEKIKTSQCDFDTSIAGLTQLKTAEVSDLVITAMLSAKTGSGLNNNSPALASSDPNDPTSPHEPGIWMLEEVDGKSKMKQLEPSVYAQHTMGAGIGAAFGVPINQEAILSGAHAVMFLTNRQPVFYFYFERPQAGFSDFRGPTSPNEYILAQFEVKQNQNQQERRLIIGSFSAYAGGRSGAESKSVRSFDFDKLGAGAYKVTLKENLTDGEYGFFYAANAGNGGKVFDFGIKGSAETEPKAVFSETKTSTKPNKFKEFFQFKKASDTNGSTQTNQSSSVKL